MFDDTLEFVRTPDLVSYMCSIERAIDRMLEMQAFRFCRWSSLELSQTASNAYFPRSFR